MRNNRDASEVRKRCQLSRPLLQEESDQNGEGFYNSEDMIAREANFDASGTNFPYVYRPNTPREKQKFAEEGEGGFLIHDPVEDAKWKKVYEKTHVLLRPFVWLKRMKETLKDDFGSIALLLFLYLLQGIPLGLISAIPLILQSKEITYSQQAIFSFAHWPFRYLIGIFLLVVSYYVAEILGTNNGDGEQKKISASVTSIFRSKNSERFSFDVDFSASKLFGRNSRHCSRWMGVDYVITVNRRRIDTLNLKFRKNVGYASTCNVVGQTVGFFMGNVVFLTLQSKDFANKWIRSVPSDKGLVEFDGKFILLTSFVFFWGWVFVISTTLVLIFKHEIDHSLPSTGSSAQEKGESVQDDEELELGVTETYSILVRILCLKPMGIMVFVLLTAKIAFAATDSMTDLKLIAAGITTDKIASRSIFLTPLQVILPWLLGKQTAGPKPLNVFLWAYPYRLFMGIVFAALVYWTPSFREPNGEYPYLYYVIWIGAYYLQQISSYCIFLSMMAFNAQISDPKIGGTYMTLLNTLGNLGGNWPATLVLSVTDFFNRKNCVSIATKAVLGTCNSKNDEELCKAGGDVCEFEIDGYYISAAICTIIGLIWYKFFYSRIQYFQKIPRNEWRVMKKGN
ncbi:Acetyl-coenzyme A transporter 1 family protein [Aphelenchoides besseyi]|nr:Acetyl-coenzyme A transporter 1 family protein [Aphelenchoides besseyi]